jgi:predicted membrane-bound spermidine synthase
MPFFELGSLVVALTFGILAVLALVCVLLPLARIGWRAPQKTGVLLYFGGLGVGFMAVEIGLMLRAQAWLGSPVLAAAVVLTALLVASGAGSLWSEHIAAETRNPRYAVAAIIAGIAVVASLLSVVDGVARTWPAWLQLAVLAGIVAPLGVALGMAFPLGLRQLEAIRPAHVPWAWAINGCASVVTPAGAMLLAISGGFGALFIAAATAYGVALAGAMLNVETATRSGSAPR